MTAVAYTLTVGSPRAYVAALLATSFRTASTDEASDVRALHETALATVERARLVMAPGARRACFAEAEKIRDTAARMPVRARVPVMAAVIRELLIDAPPETYCALDMRVRDACERHYPLADEHRDVVAAIVERTVLRVGSLA